MAKVFIDGKAGTTGLRIFERIGARKDIEMIVLSEAERKDTEARRRAINSADIAFLCLPDAAAIEAVSLVENDHTVIIDTSTAHRTNEDWAYGFAELGEDFEEKIKNSKRIAVPGCHASGFIALVHPLVKAGILSKDVYLTCHSITGYSGGGKKMIAEYESEDKEKLLFAPRQYAIGQQHKHLKEMVKISGLDNAPVFCPIVSDFYSGMAVTVPLFKKDIKGSIADIEKVYAETYRGDIVKYEKSVDEGGFISALAMADKDSMKVTVCGNEERVLLIAVYDNLGKGASGAAVECMNISLGLAKDTDLSL